MRILVLSTLFPTDRSGSQSRAARLVDFLQQRGHDLRVLCASEASATSGDDAGTEQIIRIGGVLPFAAERKGLLKQGVYRLRGAVRQRPDPMIGWRKPAVDAARALFETWNPDVVYATCPPHSTAIIAAKIARIADVPFITEFGERWSIPSSGRTSRNERWNRQMEQDVLNRAAGIISASPLWGESYARRFGAGKVVVSMTGFDPQAYPLHSSLERDADRRSLNLVHIGSSEYGSSDPRTLFRGIAALGSGAKDIRVTLVGGDAEAALHIATEEKIHKQVQCLRDATSEEVIAAQYRSDVLAFTLPNLPQQAGSIPDALFAAIGTRRPLIATGPAKGNAAEIVRKRNLGVFTNEPKIIASKLAHQLAKKRAVGTVASLPETVRENASSDAQFAPIEAMLYRIASVVPTQIAAE